MGLTKRKKEMCLSHLSYWWWCCLGIAFPWLSGLWWIIFPGYILPCWMYLGQRKGYSVVCESGGVGFFFSVFFGIICLVIRVLLVCSGETSAIDQEKKNKNTDRKPE